MEEKQKEPSRRERNVERVVECALRSFVHKGIDSSKVMEIAKEARLTERSVFRYFETKGDLVLASCLLFWDRAVLNIREQVYPKVERTEKGIDRLRAILLSYVDLFFTDRETLLFCMEAEAYLARLGKAHLLLNRPPKPFETSDDPLALAIKEGIASGELAKRKDVALLYENTYDALLGLMQKMASTSPEGEEKERERLSLFVDTLIRPFEKE